MKEKKTKNAINVDDNEKSIDIYAPSSPIETEHDEEESAFDHIEIQKHTDAIKLLLQSTPVPEVVKITGLPISTVRELAMSTVVDTRIANAINKHAQYSEYLRNSIESRLLETASVLVEKVAEDINSQTVDSAEDLEITKRLQVQSAMVSNLLKSLDKSTKQAINIINQNGKLSDYTTVGKQGTRTIDINNLKE